MKKIASLIVFMVLTMSTLSAAFAQDETGIELESESAVLMDTKSGKILYEKNGSQRMAPASLTKIATAIYAIETSNLEEIAVVSENAECVEGTRVYLEAGETMSLRQLIQGLLINSGNDAAIVIAEHIHGSTEKFAEHLNQYLKEKIGVHNTHFLNPHGLYEENHYTSAADMAKITNYALQNDIFRDIFGTKQMEWHGQSWDTTLVTHHLLLKGEYAIGEAVVGGKTGYVDESLHTLATAAKNDQIELTAVTLKSRTKEAGYLDTLNLLRYGFQNYQTQKLSKNKEYKVGNHSYKSFKSIYYTKPIDGFVSEEINENGTLKIKDVQGKLLDSFQLTPIQAKAAQSNQEGQQLFFKHRQPTLLIYSFLLVVSMLFIWMIVAGILKKKH